MKWKPEDWVIIIIALSLFIPLLGGVLGWFIPSEIEKNTDIWEKILLAVIGILGMYLGTKKKDKTE